MFAPEAQTPRPPGKAGRYEFTLEDLRVLQTSPLSLLRVSAAANHPRRPLFLSRRGADGRFEVWFAGDGGALRAFAPSILPAHESAFAMTVHKSQGSEFAQVLLILPETPSPLLTRSLFYTGITRAKQQVEIWGLPARLLEAVNTRAERAAGLAERLALPDAIRPDVAPAKTEQLGLFD